MLNGNPYSVVGALKRKRESSEQILWWTKIALVLVVAMLLREPLSIYLLSNTAHRLEQLIFRTGAILVAITALHTYTDVVRHPERFIFGVHPIRAIISKSVGGQQAFAFLYAVGIGNMEWCFFGMARLDCYLYLSSWFGGLGIGYAVH